MPIFDINNNLQLRTVQKTNFPLEKDLQTLIENNLITVFNCRFIASEFSTGAIHAGRIDTLALSEDNNPVIIEYKKVESSELITQSLFYLHWIQDHKGDFENYLIGTPQIENLQEDDHILILESCTHLTSCEDIGRFKIPRWLQEYTHKKLHFTVVPGLEDIKDYSKYKLVIQCGGCMITRKQILNRLKPAIEHNIPVTNYGMLIAYMSGIFNRATSVFR